jgi:hypothetical protein
MEKYAKTKKFDILLICFCVSAPKLIGRIFRRVSSATASETHDLGRFMAVYQTAEAQKKALTHSRR